MIPLNDEWLFWPPDALEGFFRVDGHRDAPVKANPQPTINHEEPEHENTGHAFFLQ